jgi:hypothetical protein
MCPSSGVIGSADEFVELRTSDNEAEHHQAVHDELPEAVCLEIIERFPDMRKWVAQNKTVPLAILRVLAVDPDERVRRMVAMKRKLDRELFELFSRDPDEIIRAGLTTNRKLPLDILQQLATDESSFVRAAAVRRLDAREATER